MPNENNSASRQSPAFSVANRRSPGQPQAFTAPPGSRRTFPAAPASTIAAANTLQATLPFHAHALADNVREYAPAILFAPTHLKTAGLRFAAPAPVPKDGGETSPFSFSDLAEKMLNPQADEEGEKANPSFDFDEYIYLDTAPAIRRPPPPILWLPPRDEAESAQPAAPAVAVPIDPHAWDTFLSHADSAIAELVEQRWTKSVPESYSLEEGYAVTPAFPEQPQIGEGEQEFQNRLAKEKAERAERAARTRALRIRATNLLVSNIAGLWFSQSSYSQFQRLLKFDAELSTVSLPAFQVAFNSWFTANAGPAIDLVAGYLWFYASAWSWQTDQGLLDLVKMDKPATADHPVLSAEFWDDCTDAVFDVEPLASLPLLPPPSEPPPPPPPPYPFDPFPEGDVRFGVRLIHRQTWKLISRPLGELVRTIPLGPRESRKISIKTSHRTKQTRTAEEATSIETTTEASATAKDSSEVVRDDSSKLNSHVETEVNGGYKGFIGAKVSGGVSWEVGHASKDTKSRINETMQKTASRIKRDTKIVVSLEGEDSYEETASSELTNPNDELAITYRYHRLQEHYYVNTGLGEMNSIVFVPQAIPTPEEVDETWIRDHAETIASALLDKSLAPVLAAIRSEPAEIQLAVSPGHNKHNSMYESAAANSIETVGKLTSMTGNFGFFPDVLATGTQALERDLERQNNRIVDKARRNQQTLALTSHIRRNILHYMRSIWASEDYDQRMQRLSKIRVPVKWSLFPCDIPPDIATSPPTVEREVEFVPDYSSSVPLTEVIDPIGPISYVLNCAIFRLKSSSSLTKGHLALNHLRASYTRYKIRTAIFSGNTCDAEVRETLALSPAAPVVDYRVVYLLDTDTGARKWFRYPGNFALEEKNGWLDVCGVLLHLGGTPVEETTIHIHAEMTNELEDPHFRVIRYQNPLPDPQDENSVFDDELLAGMKALFEMKDWPSDSELTWQQLKPERRQEVRERYQQYLYLRETGEEVIVDSGNLALNLQTGETAAIEKFKLLHRYLDVMKEAEELHRRQIEGKRRQALIDAGMLGDPEIENAVVTDNAANLLALAASHDNHARKDTNDGKKDEAVGQQQAPS